MLYHRGGHWGRWVRQGGHMLQQKNKTNKGRLNWAMPHTDFILLIYMGPHDLLHGFHVYFSFLKAPCRVLCACRSIFVLAGLCLAATSCSRSDDVTFIVCLVVSHFIFLAVLATLVVMVVGGHSCNFGGGGCGSKNSPNLLCFSLVTPRHTRNIGKCYSHTG